MRRSRLSFSRVPRLCQTVFWSEYRCRRRDCQNVFAHVRRHNGSWHLCNGGIASCPGPHLLDSNLALFQLSSFMTRDTHFIIFLRSNSLESGISETHCTSRVNINRIQKAHEGQAPGPHGVLGENLDCLAIHRFMSVAVRALVGIPSYRYLESRQDLPVEYQCAEHPHGSVMMARTGPSCMCSLRRSRIGRKQVCKLTFQMFSQI